MGIEWFIVYTQTINGEPQINQKRHIFFIFKRRTAHTQNEMKWKEKSKEENISNCILKIQHIM